MAPPQTLQLKYPVGKLQSGLLEGLLNSIEIRDRMVVVGPKIGEDAAVIDIGNKHLIAKSNPNWRVN